MKIEKYIKGKNGMYQVVIDSEKYKIHEDLILKYGLLLSKSIDDDELNRILNENIKYEAYDIAIREINKKMRCKVELIKILKKKNIDIDTINNVIEILEEQGYLNEEVYVDSYIHDKMVLSNFGPLKIKRELQGLGFSDDVIDLKLESFSDGLERERVQSIIRKNLKVNKKSEYVFKTKIKNTLIDLGYHSDIVFDEASKIKIDESDSYKRDYDKIYQKYSKKFQGVELEYKVKQAMYQKGYRV